MAKTSKSRKAKSGKAEKGKSAKAGKSKSAKPAKPAKAPKVTAPKGSGEIYTRTDGRYAFRVRAANGQIVASSQGYSAKSDARSTLSNLLSGGYDGPITEL